MPEIIAGVLLSFFAVIGIVELSRCVKNYMLAPCSKSPAFVVTCAGHDEQIEYCVRSLANQAVELCPCGKRLIVVVDEGMDDETRSICERLEQDIDGVTVCKRLELPRLFSGELQN
ncbi:MAG TPA: glycosyltransferase family A protein [Ruminiclostridium sp.]|nr:glycosyltransferase family A protein [Ruminiclostridium sp.]